MSSEKPLLHAIMMCDFAYRDSGTGKYTLIGTFSDIRARSFPANHGPMGLYVAMSHWVNEQEFSLQLVRESTDVVFKMPSIKIPKKEPFEKVEVGINLQSIPLVQPGRYSIEVMVNKEILHEFVFRAGLAPQIKQGE